MARPEAAPILLTTALADLEPGESAAQLPLTDGGLIEVPDVTFGMYKNVSRDKVPLGSCRLGKNARVRDDWTGRRPGSDEVGTKPDSNRVIGVIEFIKEDGQKLVCRVTQSTFHVWNGSIYTSYTINDGGFKGTAKRVTASQLFGKMYLAFDTSEEIWEVDFDARALNLVDGSARGKFTITFAERILVANLTQTVEGIKPNAFAWSANSLPLDWTGEGSGFEDLIGSDLGNHITGFEALENLAVIVRRKSLVHVTRQPFNLAPFATKTIIRGYGSDLPYTTVRVPGGIIFADARTKEVYYYTPGALPRAIGPQVERLFFEDLASAQFAEAKYNPYEGEYILGLIWTTDNELITRRWVCNIRKPNFPWTYDDSPTLSCLGSVCPPADGTSIDELTGTINALTGSIDSLSSRAINNPEIFAGISTGEVVNFSYDHATDWDDTAFEFEFDSPNLGSLSRRRTMKDLEVTCGIPVTGSVTVEQSKDESTWTNTKTASRTGSTALQKVRLPKTQITGDDLFWRIKSTASQFKIYHWWARMMDKGVQAGGQQG
jgi:hypothetical protein